MRYKFLLLYPFSILIFAFAFGLISCGLPSYQYLYPPNALIEPYIGFKHDSDNNPAFFLGYDIFYKFYETKPNGSDKSLFSTNAASFRSVSDNLGGSTAYESGFRNTVISGQTPELPIDEDERDDLFYAEIINETYNEAEEITLTLTDYLSVDETFVLHRMDKNSEGEYKSFFPDAVDAYGIDDSDLYFEPPADGFFVGFFAVIYGEEDGVFPVFANTNSEDIVFLGSIQLP